MTAAQLKKEEFLKLVGELKAFTNALTAEEKAALEISDDEDGTYENQFFLTVRERGGDREEIEEQTLKSAKRGIDHCTNLLEGLKSDLEDYRAKQKRLAEGITSVKLLARYLKLPKYWRGFVCNRLDDGRGGSNDETIRDIFAGFKDDEKDTIEFLETFLKILKEVEEVQDTVPSE